MEDSMLPNTNQENIISFSPSSKKRVLIILFLIVFLIIASGFGYYFWQNKGKFLPQTKQTASEKIILQVGEENIYQKDLDRLTQFLPKEVLASQSAQQKELLLNQLVQESIILQGAQADNLVKLDPSFFNSSNKNYQQRAKTVEQILKALDDQTLGVKGKVIAIWFYNPASPSASLSESARKQQALAKITDLYNKVKQKQITIEQAGEICQKDSSLAKLDKDYQLNCFFTFTIDQTHPSTTFPDFDKKLLALKEGDLTEIYLGSKPKGYLFAQAEKVVNQTQFTNFSDWLKAKIKLYQVKNY